MLLALAVVAGALLVGSLLPTPARTASRVLLAFFVVLLPVTAVAWALSEWDRASPATYLALLPLTFCWLAVLDLRWGVSARLARRPARARRS